MQHRQLVGLAFGQGVHDVIGKVEMLDVLKGDRLQCAVLLRGQDIVLIDAGLLFRLRRRCVDIFRRRGLRLTVRAEYDRIEQAVLPLHRDHPVRCCAVIIDAVPGGENLDMLAHLHLQLAGNDDVAFLPSVRGELDVTVLRFRPVFRPHIERVGDAVFEPRRQVVIGHPVRVLNALPFAAARDHIARKLRAAALNNIRHIHAERQRTAV